MISEIVPCDQLIRFLSKGILAALRADQKIWNPTLGCPTEEGTELGTSFVLATMELLGQLWPFVEESVANIIPPGPKEDWHTL